MFLPLAAQLDGWELAQLGRSLQKDGNMEQIQAALDFLDFPEEGRKVRFKGLLMSLMCCRTHPVLPLAAMKLLFRTSSTRVELFSAIFDTQVVRHHSLGDYAEWRAHDVVVRRLLPALRATISGVRDVYHLALSVIDRVQLSEAIEAMAKLTQKEPPPSDLSSPRGDDATWDDRTYVLREAMRRRRTHELVLDAVRALFRTLSDEPECFVFAQSKIESSTGDGDTRYAPFDWPMQEQPLEWVRRLSSVCAIL